MLNWERVFFLLSKNLYKQCAMGISLQSPKSATTPRILTFTAKERLHKTSVFFLSSKDLFYGDLPRRFANYKVWIFLTTFGFESGEISKIYKIKAVKSQFVGNAKIVRNEGIWILANFQKSSSKVEAQPFNLIFDHSDNMIWLVKRLIR